MVSEATIAVSYALSSSMTSCCCRDSPASRAALASGGGAADRAAGGPLGLFGADASQPTSKGRARPMVAPRERRDECAIGRVGERFEGRPHGKDRKSLAYSF